MLRRRRSEGKNWTKGLLAFFWIVLALSRHSISSHCSPIPRPSDARPLARRRDLSSHRFHHRFADL